MSEQCASHMLSKHIPACLRTALSICQALVSGSVQRPPGEQKDDGQRAHLGDPGGEGAGQHEPRSTILASYTTKLKALVCCAT